MLDLIESLQKKKMTFLHSIILGLFLLVCSVHAQNTQSTWIGGTTGNWNTGTNWNPGVVPNNNGTNTYDVTINSGANVSLNTAAAINNLNIASGNTLGINNAQSLSIANGSTIVNNGTLSINASSSATNLYLAGGNVSLEGTGTVSFSNSLSNYIRDTADNGYRFTNVSNTIQGSGNIGYNTIGITNQSLINANQSSALTLDPSALGMINTGIMQSSLTGTLTLQNGTFTNTGGTIRALDSSTVNLTGSTIVGGTLSTFDSGVIRTTGTATLNGVTLNGNFQQNATTSTYLQNTITNTGTIGINATTSATNMYIDSAETILNGSGTITMTNSASNYIRGSVNTNRLTNENNIIQGSGFVGANTTMLTNRGTIQSTNSTALTLNPTGASSDSVGMINSGILKAINGSRLVLAEGNYQNFENTTSGQILADSSTVAIENSKVSGGIITVQGNGTLELNSSTIEGGILTNSSTGTIKTTGGTSTLDGNIVLSNTAGGNISIQNGTALKLKATGTYNNYGNIGLNAASVGTYLVFGGGDVTLKGGGTVTLGASSANFVIGEAATDRLINEDNIIQGSAYLGNNTMGFVNQNIIQANNASMSLILNPSAAGIVNTGTLRAINGATLQIQDGSIQNAGGAIQAQENSLVKLVNTTNIQNGTLTTTGTGLIQNTGVTTLTNLTNAGKYQSANGSNTTLVGTIQNTGQITLAASTVATELFIEGGDVTLQGGGSLILSNSTANQIKSTVSTNRLINKDNLIQGSGYFGLNSMGIVNESIIEANQTVSLILDPSATGLTNTGIMRAVNGATLDLQNGTFTNTGGTIQAQDSSTVRLYGTTTIQGGTLTTTGTGTILNVGAATLNNLTNAGKYQASNGSDTTLVGTIQNTSQITLAATSTATEMFIEGGDVTLQGGGSLILSNSTANQIKSTVSTNRLINKDNLIQGSGSMGMNSMGFVNESIIEANQSIALIIDPSATGFTNTGIMRAVNGGTMDLQNGTFLNTNGTIEAQDGSTVKFTSATIQGGTLTTSGTGIIQNVNVATLENLTNAGKIQSINGSDTYLRGVINNTGEINLAATSVTTELFIDSATVTLQGAGTITLSNSAANQIKGTATTNRLINENNTIQGAGNIGMNAMGLTNRGIIDANQSLLLTINPTNTETVYNEGTLRASGGGGLKLTDGTFTNTGIIEATNGSTFTVDSFATLTNYSANTLTGGTWKVFSNSTLSIANASISTNNANVILSGTGSTFTQFNPVTMNQGSFSILEGRNFTTLSNLTNAGAMTIDDNSIMTVNGSFTQQSTGVLNIEIADLTHFSLLNSSGSVNFAGILNVTFVNGYNPNLGDSFTIMNFLSSLGAFSSVNFFNLAEGLGLEAVYNPTNLVLMVTNTAVPEPASWFMLILGLVCFIKYRFRK